LGRGLFFFRPVTDLHVPGEAHNKILAPRSQEVRRTRKHPGTHLLSTFRMSLLVPLLLHNKLWANALFGTLQNTTIRGEDHA